MTMSNQQSAKPRAGRPSLAERPLAATGLLLLANLLPSCVFVGSDKHAKLLHAHDHECKKAEVVVQRPAPNVAVTQGCGTKDATYYHVLSGITWRNTVAPLLERVRFERPCGDDVTWTVLNATSVGVSACGTRMVYVSTVDGWVLNSDTGSST